MADGESGAEEEQAAEQIADRPRQKVMEAGWAEALEPVAGQITAMGDFLRAEGAAGRTYLPAGENVLRAFQQPFGQVRVLIVGQDPYPTPGHPIGLSFSVAATVKRRPDPVDRARGAAAEPGADRAAAQARLAPGQGLGRGHRPGHPGAGRPGRPAGGHLVGPGRAEPGAVDAGRAEDRVVPPEPVLGRPRVLRLASVQPGQRAAGQAGRRPDRLAPALATAAGPFPEVGAWVPPCRFRGS